MVASLNSAGTGLSASNESAWGLALDAKDRAVVFAAGRSEAAPSGTPPVQRTDLDRYVLRFTTGGSLDATFAGDGKFSFDVSGGANDSARTGRILEDGRILSLGYTSINTKNHVALAMLNEDGTPDGSFDLNGFLITNPLQPEGVVEAYGGAVQSDGSVVTVGYGNNGMQPTALISLRFTEFGMLDGDFASNGMFYLNSYASAQQGRNIIELPDDRLLVVGNSAQASNAGDGLVALLTKDGELDTSFNGTGHKSFDLGGAGDQLWGLAVSPDGKNIAVAGFSAGAATAPQEANSAIGIYALEN